MISKRAVSACSSAFLALTTSAAPLRADTPHQRMRAIYREYLDMKDDPAFRARGFSSSSPYQGWPAKLRVLQDDQDYGIKLLRRCDVVPGELYQLAMAHIDRFSDTKLITEWEPLWAKCFSK